MAVIIDKPHPALPPDHRPLGGVAYRVKNGDNWVSLAERLGMPAKSLIFFNFATSEPKYVNYYLKHNVGCKVVSPDGKNYSFWDASPGIIYVPSARSHFVYATAPVDPVAEFHVISTGRFTLKDDPDPKHPDKLWCKAFFEVSIAFNRSLVDVTPYVYRQFIKGRVRVRTTVNSDWHRVVPTPIEVPAHKPGTPFVAPTELVPIKESEWMEDGAHDIHGNALRYGYREAPPHFDPTDMYSDPVVTAPPAHPGDVWQTGYRYRATDFAGVANLPKEWVNPDRKKNPLQDPVSINGVSVELEFRHEVCRLEPDLRKVVLRSQTKRLAGAFEITSRRPLISSAIPVPP